MYVRLSLILSVVCMSAFVAGPAAAWTGPTQAAPNGNVAAPVNVGATAQVKSGTIGVNGLAVFGNSLLQASSYLNWGATAGLLGYGIRDNAGTLEFKNSGGTGGTSGWKSLQTIINEYITLAGGNQWTTSGSSIYYNAGNVGIGTAVPTSRLHVLGTRALFESGTAVEGGEIELAGPTDAATSDFILDNYSGRLRVISGNPVAERLSILQNGNVGISTANPAWDLDITDAAAPVIALRETDTGGSTFLGQDGNSFFIRRGAIGNPDALNISSGGNVGLGGAASTDASLKLNVQNGGMRMNHSASYDVWIQGGASTAGGDNRNLAMIGSSEANGDRLYINWYGEYANGTEIRGTAAAAALGVFNPGAHYAVYGESTGQYGIYGRTLSASYGGVLGYAANNSTYGILGHANAYSLYGNASSYVTGTSYASGFIYLSDERLKKNVRPIENSLWKLAQLDGVTFDWSEEKGGHEEGKHDVGVIAQDVEKVFPEAVTIDIDSGYKAVDYPRLVPLLIGAIKEQQVEIEELRTKSETQQADIDQMRADIEALKSR